MEQIPLRDLRNNASAVLRRVEQGERLRVTVSGRPVADLVPISTRSQWLSWEEFTRDKGRWQTDSALAGELRNLLPDETEDAAAGH